ncbi:MAG TPA: arginine deiminase-related protein [Saprospiraceae bacterium]|nr:arginine deiminase-related protein [Saprospiraceae bacterium]
MIRPSAFGYNTETAENNAFQNMPVDLQNEEVVSRAQNEFDLFVGLLRYEGIDVTVIEDTSDPAKPDAVFPNNWISFHGDGTVVTYPMYSKLRRSERREEVIDELNSKFTIQHREHFEYFEKDNQYLEGTGSMVLDRANGIAYACISDRTDRELLEDWCDRMQFTPHTFYAESKGKPIYHTNVMMAIASSLAVVCLECLPNKAERLALKESLEKNHAVVEITHDQVQSFAGNMLALKNRKGEELMIMSERAFDSLNTQQRNEIEKFTRIVSAPINTIEDIGGGSARCMIAEIFLPAKSTI